MEFSRAKARENPPGSARFVETDAVLAATAEASSTVAAEPNGVGAWIPVISVAVGTYEAGGNREVADACLQLFGGYGYMLEYPVTWAYIDARMQRIYAGTDEITKVIIAKQMGL